ncbi:MAG: sigma 54-interacting transcriptional regulator, partial [Byssovorax sp.]
FLDEIGDMDPAIQSRFLDVIEARRYRRLGDSRERRSDFRLVCATNRNLDGDVESGLFRRDLFYRINVFPIAMPPLRERLEDLGPLVQHVMAALGEPERSVRPEAYALLLGYRWPGNIRELRNVLERALLLSGRAPIGPEHFPGLEATGAADATPADGGVFPFPGGDGSELDADRIASALRLTKGNKTRAAELLGISRATLYRKIS